MYSKYFKRHSVKKILLFTIAFSVILLSSCKKNNTSSQSDSSSSLFKSYQLLNSAYEQFYVFGANYSGDEVKALSETAKWLQDKDGIKSVYITDSTYLTAELEDGLEFQLIINYVDNDGKSLYRGGKGEGKKTWMKITGAGNTTCSNNMPNKKILLWAPPYYQFQLSLIYPDIIDKIKSSDIGLDDTVLKFEECTPASLKSIDQYGVVIFDTHGTERSMLTGVRVSFDGKIENATEFKTAMIADIGSDAYDLFTKGELNLSSTVELSAAGNDSWWTKPHSGVNGEYEVWASSKFFNGKLDLSNTVIFNNSCYSGATKFKKTTYGGTPDGITIASAFLADNPIAYYGWRYVGDTSAPVWGDACNSAENNFVKRLTNNDSTGLWNKLSNGDPIEDNYKKGLFLSLDRYDNYCYEDSCGSFTDPRDGKVYKLACINGQTWFAGNLNYETANSLYYDNDPANGEVYGRLYTWDEAKTACPAGWHLPSDDEWTTLANSLGGSNVAGGIMKEAGTEHWSPPNTGATNSSGFNALPGGGSLSAGSFGSLGTYCYMWSATDSFVTDAYACELSFDSDHEEQLPYPTHVHLSVRCLKN